MKSEIGAVASLDLIATNPELHHYTTFSGLKGIVQSNALWATHFLDLNDSREVFLLEDALTATVKKLFLETLRARQRHSLRIKRRISRFGGLENAATGASTEFVKTLYDETFVICQVGGPGRAALLENGLDLVEQL